MIAPPYETVADINGTNPFAVDSAVPKLPGSNTKWERTKAARDALSGRHGGAAVSAIRGPSTIMLEHARDRARAASHAQTAERRRQPNGADSRTAQTAGPRRQPNRADSRTAQTAEPRRQPNNADSRTARNANSANNRRPRPQGLFAAVAKGGAAKCEPCRRTNIRSIVARRLRRGNSVSAAIRPDVLFAVRPSRRSAVGALRLLALFGCWRSSAVSRRLAVRAVWLLRAASMLAGAIYTSLILSHPAWHARSCEELKCQQKSLYESSGAIRNLCTAAALDEPRLTIKRARLVVISSLHSRGVSVAKRSHRSPLGSRSPRPTSPNGRVHDDEDFWK